MRNNEEYNVNINLSNGRFSNNTNKPTIESNKRKILLPQSCNDEPISKHSKVEKSISCKPISSLLDKNISNESRLVDPGLLTSEIRNKDGVNVSETEVVKNKVDSNSKSDNTHTKKYTENSEHILILPPQVTTVYAKVASHPDITYTNTSLAEDCLNYASVPPDKVILPQPYVKKSPTTSNVLLQDKSKGTLSHRPWIEKVKVNPAVNKNIEKRYSKSKKHKNVSKTINEKLLTDLEPPSTSKQNIEVFDKNSQMLKADSTVKIEDENILDMTKQHITKSSKIDLQASSKNNLNKICESSQGNALELTEYAKIISFNTIPPVVRQFNYETEKVKVSTLSVNSVKQKEKDKLNVDSTKQSKVKTKQVTNKELSSNSIVKDTGVQSIKLPISANTKIHSKVPENHKVTEKKSQVKNNVKNLKPIQIISPLETEQNTPQIQDVKNSSQKNKSNLKNEENTLEQKKSSKKSDQSKSRECEQTETSQEEFMLTVQLQPVSRTLPKIINYKLPEKLCTNKIENICLNLEAFANRKIPPQENNNEKQIKKCSKKGVLKTNKNKTEDKSEKEVVDVEHNINMLASVALTSSVLEADDVKQSLKCTKVLTRKSSNKCDKDEDFAKATNTNVIKVKRKTSVDSKTCNSSKKVKEDISDKKSENTNKTKCENDSILATKVTNNGNKSIDNLAMVLWEKKNKKSSESLDNTIFHLDKIYDEAVTSTPKHICSNPKDSNFREIKKEDISIDDKIAMNCSVIVEDLVKKNMDGKNDSQDDEDKILSNNFNFDANISSFVCNRLNLDKILETSCKESEVNMILEKTLNAVKLKDEIEKVKEISLSVLPNFEHNKKEVNSEYSISDFDGWFNFLPSPTLDCDLSETLNLEDLINETDTISSTANTISLGDRLISGYNGYITSKDVGHSNNAFNPFDFPTASDFFELEYSLCNTPEQLSNGNTCNESIDDTFFTTSSETQPILVNSLQLNPNEFLNLSTESVIEKLESSKTRDSPDLEVISLEEMKIMPTDNILNKSISKETPSVEELKKQIYENMEKKKIIKKNDTPSKLSRRMHKIPSGTTNKKIKQSPKIEEENISITKNSDSDNRNLNSVFSNNDGSLPSLVDDNLLLTSYDLKNKLPITDKPDLVKNLFNSQSLPLVKLTTKSDTDYSEIFNKLKNEEKNETKTLPTVKLTTNSLITLKKHDESASLRKQSYNNLYQSQNSFILKSSSSTITKPANNLFENSKKNNLSNIRNCSDNKLKLSTFRHPNVVENIYYQHQQNIYSHNRRKTDPNETHSNINLSDSKSHSQSSNSICCPSTNPPNKKKKNVYAPIGIAFKEEYCLKKKWRGEKIGPEKVGNEITAGKK